MHSRDASTEHSNEAAQQQLDTLRSSELLAHEFCAFTPISTATPSSRTELAAQALEKLKPLLPLAGIVRISDISQLAPGQYPVCQAVRPRIFSHAFLGQNTGSQGRGATPELAQISAIMENLEVYCAEPRNAWLVRGSYEFLRRTHFLLPPEQYLPASNVKEPATRSEPLLWTTAFCVEQEVEVLVPAEAAFYALNARDYQTRPIFPSSSNGLGAGGTLIEAALHGLYELIERHYIECWQVGDPGVVVERLQMSDGPHTPDWAKFRAEQPEALIAVLAFRSTHVTQQLANVICAVFVDGEFYWGSCCHHDADAAVGQALGEALQSRPTAYAASREDIVFRTHPTATPGESGEFPAQTEDQVPALFELPETLSLGELRHQTSNCRAASLQQRFQQLTQHVHELGCAHVLIKNLTRVGLEVPVVRVIVPGLRMQAFCIARARTFQETIQCQYSLDL